jgi:hypothetical protein
MMGEVLRVFTHEHNQLAVAAKERLERARETHLAVL